MPEPHDDPTIDDDERLFHRIWPEQVSTDSETGRLRPSSGAFRSTSNIVSVDIGSLTTPQSVLEAYPSHLLVEVSARDVRSIGCKIVRDPEPNNPSHALIYGSAPNGGLTKSQAKKIAKSCRWAVLGDQSNSA